ncbi:MAG: hypothetical protein F6K58_23220 [Symploca sp. SIO2E9]|nr:hypothetical protein [Symploca sp. SIO2E9]
MTKREKKRIQISIKQEASEMLAKLADKLGLSLSSMTEKILEEKLLDKRQKIVNERVNRMTSKFLRRLAHNKIQELPGIGATAESVSPSANYSTFKIILSNTGTSSVDLRDLIVQFPVDDKLQQDLAVNSFSSNSVSYPAGSNLEIQGNPSIAITSVQWSEENWVDTVLDSGQTFEIIYGVSSEVNQQDLDAVIAGNIQVSTGKVEYKLTVLTPNQPAGVTAGECTFSVSGGNGSPITKTIPWHSSTVIEEVSAGTYTLKPQDIVEGNLVYQGISKTVELTFNSPTKTLICEYAAPVEQIQILLSVDSEYADYNKTVNFVGIDGNMNQYEFSMVGQEKTVGVLPGEYNISASSLTIGDKLYQAKLNNPYNLINSTSIKIEYEEVTAKSLVKGWPIYIAHGAVTTNSTSTTDTLKQRPVDAIFKYAGIDGAGDQGLIIQPQATQNTVLDSRTIEEATGQPVMPVMVVYTIEGSGSIGKMVEDLSLTPDSEAGGYLWKHYVNLSTIANTLQSAKDADHSYPGCIILNPDALGMLQQNQNSPDTQKILTSTIAVNDNLA